MKFLSDKWICEYEPLVRNTFSKGKTPTAVSGKVIEKYLNVSGQNGKDVWLTYEWEDGIIVEQNHGIGLDSAPRDADFSIMIDMNFPKKLLKGEIKRKDIMSSGELEFNVNFIKFMPVERSFIYMQKLKVITKLKTPIIHMVFLSLFNRTIKSVRSELLERGVELK